MLALLFLPILYRLNPERVFWAVSMALKMATFGEDISAPKHLTASRTNSSLV